MKTIAGFWPLLAGIASKEQAEFLADELQNANTFHRPHRVPTLAADQWATIRAVATGGAVWAPTDTMVIRGLERYGFDRPAGEIAVNYLVLHGRGVPADRHRVGELRAGAQLSEGKPAKGDFVGWSGIGPTPVSA